MQQLLSVGQVARLLGIPPHRLSYAHASLALAEPELRIMNKRMYTTDDVNRVAEHFGVVLASGTGTGGEGADS